jgi:DNA-binding SARP family transcriptional activator/predicted ATPase
MLEVSLLGQFDVRLDGESITFPSRSAQSLFAYLVLNAGITQRREKLAGLFWPDTAEKNARDNLRHALWRIRGALARGRSEEEHYILVDQISITFDAHSSYWLDTSILECGASDRATAADLMELLALYKGELLPGFYDEWAVVERNKLQAQFEKEVGRLLDLLVKAQRWTDILDWGERWIALSHSPEPAYRSLMLAHHALGDRSQVVAVYHRCVRALRIDLDVEPSERTRRLFQQLSQAAIIGNGAHSIERVVDQPWPLTVEPAAPAHRLPSFLTAVSAPAGDSLPFVTRERELAQLDKYLNACRSGLGQLVFVTGESGSGKTTLVHEFARRAEAAHADLIMASGICNAYTGSGDPYLPFREILNLLTGDVEAKMTAGMISPANASRLWNFMPASLPALFHYGPDLIDSFVPGTALQSRAVIAVPDGAEWLARLERLLDRHLDTGSNVGLGQDHIYEQFASVLLAMANERPLLLILDDLHWADVSSIGLLFHLSRRIRQSRILIVGAYRPEDGIRARKGQPSPLQGVLSEFKRSFGDIWIDLDRVTAAEGQQFVDALLDSEPNRLGTAFRQALFQYTEGHALFTIELLHALQERGDLGQDEAGMWVEKRAVNWETLPARVEGVIEQRVSRLSARLRQALRVASAEGEEFTAEVVARVQGLDEYELVRDLSGELAQEDRLVNAQPVQWVGAQQLSIYRFRHILFQKYLYHTLAEAERVYVHAKIASVLEAMYGEQAESIAIQLARHFQAARNINKAVDYLLQAGEQARRISANRVAIGHFKQGLASLRTLPDTLERVQRELALLLPLGNALIAVLGYADREVGETFSRAQELCHQIGATLYLTPVLRGLHRFFLTRGDAETAREIGEQLVSVVQAGHDPALLTEAQRALGITLWYCGELDAAQVCLERGMAHYSAQRHTAYVLLYGQDPGMVCLSYSAWALWFAGYPDQALKRSRQALGLAQELVHPYSLAQTLSLVAVLHQFRGEAPLVEEQAEAALALSSKHGFAYWSVASAMLRGWALTSRGNPDIGIEKMNEGLAAWRAMGIEVGRVYFLALLAQVYRKVGRHEEGLQIVDEALNNSSGVGRWIEAELYRVKGELLVDLNAAESEAEACFQQAIEIARRQGARSLELRAVASLSRLWQQEGKIREARQRLAEIYNWFSEGWDTADLKEAHALLEALA